MMFKRKWTNTPQIDWDKQIDALQVIRKQTIAIAKKKMDWHAGNRFTTGVLTRLSRFGALIFFGLGLILPLLNVESVTTFDHQMQSLGYLSLAVGGLILLFDKYFGLSSSFVRFYVTEEEIKRNINDFKLNWENEMIKATAAGFTTDNIGGLLATAEGLVQSVSNAVQLDTGAWAAEFQTQIGEVQELLKQKSDHYERPGNISITIENHKD